jgi:DNA repair protein RadC
MKMLKDWKELVCAEAQHKLDDGAKDEMGNRLTEKQILEEKEELLKPMEKMTTETLVRLILGLRKGARGNDVQVAKDFAKRFEMGGFHPTPEDHPLIRAVWELAQRFGGKRLHLYLKPRDIWEELRDVREQKKEHFVVFFLDTRNQEIKRDIISIGTLNYNLVHPREVFEPAVKNLAASIIVAHNHPSGCLEPSDEDLSLTKRLSQAGKLLGIELLDHVIVTREGFMSFKQKGLM